ncbi:hypothetical protein PC9H_001731 [Pleurotus ostreatus]|uniref:Uncharacterized protein n=1 Tax=Pleurotus ostreatus TaxID=5322 RepID=A0A8H7E0J3_PLEOS|nr:uncharacterized protein PC9H_001731 [Pleurotus ostreatus]KAF7441381.1 hypothetical protein PC9H_001731 [Pleurotus ostreatus]
MFHLGRPIGRDKLLELVQREFPELALYIEADQKGEVQWDSIAYIPDGLIRDLNIPEELNEQRSAWATAGTASSALTQVPLSKLPRGFLTSRTRNGIWIRGSGNERGKVRVLSSMGPIPELSMPANYPPCASSLLKKRGSGQRI